MSRETMQQALTALRISTPFAHALEYYEFRNKAIKDIEAELAKPEPTVCGYDETVGMCTNNPCCEQEPVSHLWECIGRWSAYLAANGKQGNLAPPTWLVDAVKAATSPPRKDWVGLTDEEIKEVLDCGRGGLVDIKKAEQMLKEKNT